MGIQKQTSVVYVWNGTPLFYLLLETREVIVGQPFIIMLCLIWWRFCFEAIFHVLCFQPLTAITHWGPLLSSMANRDNPGNFSEMSSEQEAFLPLAFDSPSLIFKNSFPINLVFWKEDSICNELLCKAVSVES